MLQVTLNSYLYQQYSDDEDLQAFVAVYNAATQTYIDWFNSVGLPFYPGLTGDLLDWVAQGLYGLGRTSLESPPTGALGPPNSFVPNSLTPNAYSKPTQTLYSVSDDLFQRILTWNFYKGDGKRFCIRWLKRRIMRFLLGTNGIDPEPWNSGFIVGCENTTPVSVAISGTTLTVTINQGLLSVLSPVAPNIIPYFQLAFEAAAASAEQGEPGILELPADFTYVINIETHPIAIATPTSESSSGIATSQTTGTASITVTGGSGEYTYAWTWQTGGAGITINSPSAAATSFSASGLTAGQTLTGLALCTVTDTVTTQTTTASVSVSIAKVSLPICSASPTSLSATGGTSSVTTGTTTVSIAGGETPYSIAWTWESGGTDIEIDSPTSVTTSFTGTNLAPNGSESGTALCTVTDAYGQQTSCTVAVAVNRTVALTASASPTTLSVTGASASESTGSTTVSASGGQAPYSFDWTWQTGGSGISINAASSATTSFTSIGLPAGNTYSGTALCTVTDSLGSQTTTTCAVSIARVTAVSASVLPTSESSSSTATSQTTGTATVSASGGEAPYSYAWEWATGGAGISINSPDSAATSFSASGMAPGDTYSGTARCTVTDAYSQTSTASVAVSIACVNVYSGTLVAGAIVNPPYETIYGYTNYEGKTIGSLSPTVDANGNTIAGIFTEAEGDSGYFLVEIESSSELGESYFGAAEIDGSTSYETSSSEYLYEDGLNTWQWEISSSIFVDGDSYAIVLT